MKQQTKELIWFNGKIVSLEEATINIMTTTAQYGVNVFEGTRCYYDEITEKLYAFRLKDHIERLFISAKLLKFELESHIDIEYITNAVKNVIKANDYHEDIYVKIGFYLDGIGSWSNKGPVGLFVAAFPKGREFSDKMGITCSVSSWQRISDSLMPPRVKAGANYLNSRYGVIEASMNGYDSTIFLNHKGTIAEGPGACIFIVREGKLITPPLTASILDSITRRSIIDFAKNDLKIEVEIREIDRTELYISDEVFFAGTSVEILPILSVDNFVVGNEEGEITKELKKLYFNIVRGKKKKYFSWLDEIY